MISISALVLVAALSSVHWQRTGGRQEEFIKHQHPEVSSVHLKSYSAVTSQKLNPSPLARRVLVLPANNQYQDAPDISYPTQQHPQLAHLSKLIDSQQSDLDTPARAAKSHEDVSTGAPVAYNRSTISFNQQNKLTVSADQPSIGIPQSNLIKSRSTSATRPLSSFISSTHTPVSITEQSNSIVQMVSSPRLAYPATSESDFRYSQMMRLSELGELAQSSGSSNQNGSTVELHNHIVYEGPATAPPVAGDYYGLADTQLAPTSSDGTSNAWWAIGLGQEFDRASNLTGDDYMDYCSQSKLLEEHQRGLCRMHPKIMTIVARGLKIAFDECQNRFSNSRWNCSLLLQDSLDSLELNADGKRQVFVEFMRHSNRERSFLNAIVAAGLAHAMTKACSANELPEECSCDKIIRLKQKKDNLEWTACSEDIDFGSRFSHDFTDNKAQNSDISSMVDNHNYGVGRQVFKSNTDLTCSCGDSGPCQIKRCWKQVGPFTNIGDILLERYESATHVQTSLHDPRKLRPVRRGLRRPKRKDLIFTEESPDYCSPDSRLGILGTQNRQCNSTTSGPNSCSNLCCDRGYQVVVEDIEEDCNCKFVWCCQLKCDKCIRHLTSEICN